MKQIIINHMPEETRMVVIDDAERIVDIAFDRPQHRSIVHHIYKGVVRNVLPGMQAAFVNIGRQSNAYLNVKQGQQKQVLGKLHEGQVLMVQAVKEEMLGKGARVTADISLAGRFMVLLPLSKGVHISKQITDEAIRNRLTTMIAPYVEKGCGFILRTAAASATEKDLALDMQFLWHTWEQIHNRYTVAKNGTELYGDADFWLRLVRDFVRPDVARILVDAEEGYQRLRDLLTQTGQEVELIHYQGKAPIFKEAHIEEQLNDLLQQRVSLPSGGFLQIDHTEALTVIDVNSGQFVGTTNRMEDMAYTVNKEAAEEIARQLRLRDIGGIIICDFIDMPKKAQRESLLTHLGNLLRKDRVTTVVCGMTTLGLVELTRKRERQGLQTYLYDTCPQCGGTGNLLAAETVYIEIVRRLREAKQGGRLRHNVCIQVHPTVASFFSKSVLRALTEELQRQFTVETDASVSPESYALLAMEE